MTPQRWGAINYWIAAYEIDVRLHPSTFFFLPAGTSVSDRCIAAMHTLVMGLPRYPGGSKQSWLADIGVPWKQNENAAFYISLLGTGR